jgi:predicted GH43/DUF377 family glycosyl hydrolase
MHANKRLLLCVALMLANISAHSRATDKLLAPELQHWLRPQAWVRDSDHPVIRLGAEGEFDDMHLFAPCVHLDDGLYRLWYCGSRSNVANRVFGLGLALSRDGRAFQKVEANPVFEFGDGKHSILTPTVLSEGGKWRMWFSATDFADGNGLHTLHESTSLDGIRWSAPSPALLSNVYAPTVLKVGNRYRMWYARVGQDPWVICHATSDDGRVWRETTTPVLTLDQPWEADRLFYPAVVRQDGVYLMWYGSYWKDARPEPKTALGFAVSFDGITWHKHPHNPVFRPEPKLAWESHYVTSESIVRMPDGRWRMWYASRTKPPFDHKYFAIGSATWSGDSPGFQTRLETIHRGYDGQTCWVHPRAGIVPGETPAVVLTMQKLQLTGSDVFFALNEMRTDDLGKAWSEPLEHAQTLGRRTEPDGSIVATCDFWPKWHAASGKLLGIGHTVRYRNETVLSDRERKTSYSIYDPEQRAWSDWTTLEMPDAEKYYDSGAGCAQRVDLPNGDILLPIYYKGRGQEAYHASVLRCRFDGTRLSVVETGSEHTVAIERGLFEPSLTKYGDRFFLTLRNDEAGYVATSDDGLHFTEPQPWRWDDGTDLGNYNTQQHWVTHKRGLFLVYTRKGANNDHVFRHRAPLFIAQVDPVALRVIRRTERVLVPERGARLGNFGVTEVSDRETWVTVAEWMQTWPPKIVIPPDNRYGADNSVYVARILWDEPSQDWNRH